MGFYFFSDFFFMNVGENELKMMNKIEEEDEESEN